MKRVIITVAAIIVLVGTAYAQTETSPEYQHQNNVETERRLLRLERKTVDLESEVTGELPLANGGTGQALVDPGADRILFWDDSDGAIEFLEAGTGISISTNSINASDRHEEFLTSGTFTAPTGVTKVFLTMVGGGGGAGEYSTNVGAGGGGGGMIIHYPYDVTPGNDYTVTVGSGGVGGITGGAANDGTDGGDTSFDSAITAPGGHGGDHGGGPGLGGTGGGGLDGLTGGAPSLKGGDGEDTADGGVGGGTIFGVGGSGSVPKDAEANTGAGGSGGVGSGGDGGSGYVLVEW